MRPTHKRHFNLEGIFIDSSTMTQTSIIILFFKKIKSLQDIYIYQKKKKKVGYLLNKLNREEKAMALDEINR